MDRGGLITDDNYIYRMEYILLESHREDAPILPAMKADALLKAGDIDG